MSYYSYVQLSLFHLILICMFMCNAQTHHHRNVSKTATLIVFGDSTVDPGNNNYLSVATFKSNFPPYGKDFIGHVPTGRFSNGRLVTDFASAYAGLKDYIPPYLDPTLTIQDLKSGVSFASAGSGYDSLTAEYGGQLISIPTQVEYFKEYKNRLENAIGKESTNLLVKNAVFVASAGTNDIVLNYFGPSSLRRASYSIVEYQNLLIQNIQKFIQDIMNEGAQRIAIVGLPPLGCLPIVITVKSPNERKCVESLSSLGKDFNQLLQKTLKEIQIQNPSCKIFYADIYNSIDQIIKWPAKHGFEEATKGCCGTGYLETTYLCNPKSTVCDDASKYVFFDSVHPTERAYKFIFDGLRSTIDLVLKE